MTQMNRPRSSGASCNLVVMRRRENIISAWQKGVEHESSVAEEEDEADFSIEEKKPIFHVEQQKKHLQQNSILTRCRMKFRHMLSSHSGPEVVMMSDSNLVVLMSTKVNPKTSFYRTQSLCRRLQNSLGHSEPMITIVFRVYHHLQASKSRTVRDFLEWKQGRRGRVPGEGPDASPLHS